MKKLTVNGIIGKTQGVSSAANPERNEIKNKLQTEVVEEEILNLEHDFVKVYNEIEQGRYAISKHEIAKWQKIPLNKLIILE